MNNSPIRIKRQIIYLIPLFIFFLLNPALGQKKYELSYTHIGDEAGLSQNTVTSIVQDSLGFLWIGTNDGLNRFDGLTMTVFNNDRTDTTSIAHGWIVGLVYDKKDRLWVATNRGLSQYHYETNSFTNSKLDLSQKDTLSGLPDNRILSIYADSKQRIWVSSWKGLYYTLDGKIFYKPEFAQQASFPNDFVNRIIEDSKGNFWIGFFDNGFARVNPDLRQIEYFPTVSLNGKGAVLKNVLSISEDTKTKDIWFGTKQQGIIRFNPDSYEAKAYDTPSKEVAAVGSNVLAQYHYKERFFVGNSLGFWEYDSLTDAFVPLIKYSEDTNARVQAIYIDKSTNLWIGTELTGLLKANIKPKRFEVIPNEVLPNKVIWSMYEDEENQIWVVTEEGVAVLSPDFKKIKWILNDPKEPIKKAGDFPITITGHKNTIWVGTTFSGVYEIDRKTYAYKNLPINEVTNSKYINVVYFDELHKTLLTGTYHGMGVYHVDTKKLDWYTPDSEDTSALPIRSVWNFYTNSDNELVLTHDLGLSFFNYSTQKFKTINVFPKDLTHNKSLSTNMLKQDHDGLYWIGTENGLIHFDLAKDSVIHLFNQSDGLANSYIYGVLIDSSNSIWVSTNKGISELKVDLTRKTGRKVRNFSKFDGLSSLEYNFNAYIALKNGTFLFGGVDGINYFNPNKIKLNTYKPNPIISELKINSGSKNYEFNLLNRSKLSFDYGANVYEFTLQALEFTSPKENEYRYRLKGFENNWSIQTGKNKILYTNLSPGEYVLEVQVSNNDKIYNETVKRINLIILPPFYLNPTYYAFLFILSVIFIVFGIKYREKKLIEQNQFLENEVQNRARDLEKNQFIFKQISDNAADLISLLDYKGNVMYASPSHYTLLGYYPEEVTGLNIFDIIHPEDVDRINAETQKMRLEGNVAYSEYRMMHKNKSWRTYQTAGSVIRYEEDEDIRYVMISHDVTRQKKIEGYLIESKEEAQRANQAKSAFLAGISHELRTPLNAILGFSQILVKERNLTPKQLAYVETMLKSGNHLLDMINEVLDISRIEAGRMPVNYDNFSLKQLINDVDQLFRLDVQRKGLELHNQAAINLPVFCFTDAGKLRQILINLVGNALKFTDSGFLKLHISLVENERENDNETSEIKWDELKNAAHNSHSISAVKRILKFVVEDTGRGIPADKLVQIFEPFQQADARTNYTEGTGLGLAISSRLVKLLGGSIKVQSEPGMGSKFEFLLPVLEVENSSVAKTIEVNRIEGIKNKQTPKILIVDDIEYNHTILKDLLEPIGFICVTVFNGKKAVEVTKSFKPDLILMDLKMPVMSGAEATKLIKIKVDENVKIIAISASGFEDNDKQRLATGFDDFILKPFKELDLMNKIAKALSIEYVYSSVSRKNTNDPDEDNFGHLYSEIKLLSEKEEAFWDAIDLMDWEQLEYFATLLEEKSVLRTYLRKALSTKDFMSLIYLSEKWNRD